ncbi:hypothetical protein SAMN05216522_10511 [Rosenbergiella nectarea]|uniref:Neck protein n=1 Tax=Rosenbergiella nectarea TaxID=988801 RepID=A0A1H9HQ28_9GAMM|nr:hypothetical protein [Rosenbergiella nectarea]SEQ64440.1 hypothetical protein SAMN05216522_10511 [Rosenbergiella nectarea]
MSIIISDNRRLQDRLRRELRRADKDLVVGIQHGAINDGVQVAEYAAMNEFGTLDIPERPFVREYFDTSVERINQFAKNGMTQVAMGNATFSQFLNSLGLDMVDGLKKSITNGNWAPNDPYTVARKGSNKPLIDTGVMLNSITYAIRAAGETE